VSAVLPADFNRGTLQNSIHFSTTGINNTKNTDGEYCVIWQGLAIKDTEINATKWNFIHGKIRRQESGSFI
jgi:hypothetical protein